MKNLVSSRKTLPGIILSILVIVAVAAPISLNKVSPIAPSLMGYFNIGETQVGMLISVFSITGIILALPGGLLICKFGPWKCVLTALIALLAGSLMGTYSDSFTQLLVSRVIEGIGMTLIAVAGPAIIGTTVPSKKRGIAMGIFSSYMGIGQVVTYNLAPRVAQLNGWKGVWWFSTIYIMLVIVVWILLMVRIKASSQNPESKAEIATQTTSIYSVIKNKSLWYLAFSMCFYIISFVSIQMFLPSYLSSNRGIDIAKASSMVSICCLAGTICSIITGIVSDKLRSRRVFGGLSLILSGGLFFMIPFFPTVSFIILIIILGLIPPILPVCVFAATTEVINDPSEGGIAMGIISLGQNIGLTIGPILFGAITQGLGWNEAFFFTIPVTIAGGMVMLFNRKVR